ncbi:hypothetical protein HK100_001297 [Physocladia obscura]|uniref:Gelsolin-like domain-containing protein n=1 Tax=Physocladia obscura TaxID=109957 RepID=A0AAD5XEY7_9FUNG|nr:hypothetical protein HK100_001297 [Physocladia obscura]
MFHFLTKPHVTKFEDSNIANIGSDLDKKARLDAAHKEPAWEGVGSKVGLRVFRIEQFQVKPVPEKDYGRFYNGDSYIVINTWKKPQGDKLYYDIHFWLGLKTSQDEAGTAAYKTVELDDYLGTLPVQHREVQNSESQLFKSYFPHFEILNGGVDSGFHHVSGDTHTPHLYKISLHGLPSHSHQGVTITEEDVISSAALNTGEVFVFDAADAVYVWIGSESKGVEKVKAQEVANRIVGERDGRVEISVYDENDSDAGPFWTALGGKGPVSKKVVSAKPVFEKTLIRLTDRTRGGKLSYHFEAKGSDVSLSKFDTKDVFIFDANEHVFVWIGKGSDDVERKNALKFAGDYLHENGRPLTLPVTRIIEGMDHCAAFNIAIEV